MALIDAIMHCECGLAYVPGSAEDEAQHRKVHDAWANGPVFIPPGRRSIGEVDDGLVIESSRQDPREYRKLFAAVAITASLETPDFKPAYYGEDDEAHLDRRAYVLQRDGRAVALLVTERVECAWDAIWRGDGVWLMNANPNGQERWAVQRIWVAANHRRRGVAVALIQLVFAHLRVSEADVAWEGPFTANGQMLVRSILPARFLLCGERGELGEFVSGVNDSPHGGG